MGGCVLRWGSGNRDPASGRMSPVVSELGEGEPGGKRQGSLRAAGSLNASAKERPPVGTRGGAGVYGEG